MTGIAAYGAYVPITRLPLSLDPRAARPRKAAPRRAVADYDEDAVTMAVTAAVDCLTGIARESVDAVYFASTTYPLREKQGAALIAKALDLRRDVLTQDHAGSLRAGTAALESALHAVAAGALRSVLVVASDCRLGAPRGALEAKLGDGAVALLVTARPDRALRGLVLRGRRAPGRLADRGRALHAHLGGPLRDPGGLHAEPDRGGARTAREVRAQRGGLREGRALRARRAQRAAACCARSASRTSRSRTRCSAGSATPARRSR